MSRHNHEIYASLNDILQLLYDSQTFFNRLVDNVSDQQLKILFREFTLSRQKMLGEIMAAIPQFGEKPHIRGTLLGKTYLVFENFKNLISGSDPLSVTNDVRRGESILIEYYKNVLSLELPTDLRHILLTHLTKIEDEIKQADLLSVE